MFRPPEFPIAILSAEPLVANQEELGEGDGEFSLRSIFVHTSK
jgi:hypothetical protein